MDKKNIEDIFALTPMQEGMLFHYLKDPGSDQYFEQLCLEISGKVEIETFRKAWNFVIETNEMLRAVFRWGKVEHPVQIIVKKHELQPKFYDFSGINPGDAKKHLEEVKAKDKKEKFDLRQVSFRVMLCKIQDAKYQMIIGNHHILYDGWSNGIILREFFNAYDELIHKRTPKRPNKTKFKEFIKWLKGEDQKEEEKFWKEYLKGFDTSTEFSVKKVKTRGKEPEETGVITTRLGKDSKEKLESFSRRHKITLAALLYGAWGILLQKYNHNDDVIFGTTVSGRSVHIEGIEDVVGLFINTLPLRVHVKPDTRGKTLTLLKEIHQALRRREKYETNPLAQVKNYSQLDNREDLFDSIIVIENYPLDTKLPDTKFTQRDQKLRVNSYTIFENTNYDLTIAITLPGEIEVRIIYNSELFSEDVIKKLSHHFKNILKGMIDKSEKEIGEIDILSEEEREQQLYDFNLTRQEYPLDKTIHQLFDEQVEKTPDRTALVGSMQLAVDKIEEVHSCITEQTQTTYMELNRQANRLAHLIREKGVPPESIVAIMVERSVEMIIGLLSILKAGGAYLPLDIEYPGQRIKYMIEDSNSQFLLTRAHLLNKVEFKRTPIVIEISDKDLYPGNRGRKPGIKGDAKDPAYIVYTSGSTGKPKGVLIRHVSVINLAFSQESRFNLDTNDKILQFSSICFDASVEQIFISLFSGSILVLIDKETILHKEKFEKFILKHSITHIHAVPSFLSNITPRSSYRLKRIISGGEVCSVALARRLSSFCDFYNEYGPTETTVTSIEMMFKDVDGNLPALPIGKPINNTTVYLLDKWLKLVPLGAPGELYIGGEGVAGGYLNNPELTSGKFRRVVISHSSLVISSKLSKFPNDQCPMTNDRLYKTGDLARWLPDGNILFLGRMDRQVKIRGFRIELGEIEGTLLKHDGIKNAVVIDREDTHGDKYLCAYIIGQGRENVFKSTPGSGRKLKEYVSRFLPDYMIPSCFIFIDKIPLTANGKVDRKALPQPEIKISKDYVAPRNNLEEKLVEIWSAVLGMEKEKIGIDDNFFELGGHSLKAIYLISRIHKFFDIEVPIGGLFKSPTVRGIYYYMGRAEQQVHRPIDLAEEREYYPLTNTQKRFYVIQQLDAANVSYNMSETMLMEGQLSRKRFEEVFRQLLSRHESLRTSFHLVGGEPVQRIHQPDEVEFKVEYYDLLRDGSPILVMEVEKIIDEFVRPFDLSKAPLWRVGSTRTAPETHYLMFDMHHIIADGTSAGLFIRDFLSIYHEAPLPLLNIRYRDYSLWRKKRRENASGLSRIISRPGQREEEVLNLPTDFMRPMVPTYDGHTFIFNVGADVTAALYNLSREEDVTLYMILLSACYILFSKLSSQENIPIGSPFAGRIHVDLDHVIGLFLNILCLRNQPTGEKRFTEFLAGVKEHTLNAFESQDYQYDELVEKTVLAWDTGRSPLFDVMFVLQNMEMPEVKIPGLRVTRDVSESHGSKFDITLHCEEKDTLIFKMEYRVKLFKEETIHRFSRYFKRIISQILENPQKTIAGIEIIPGEEKQQILYHFNDTYVEYPRDKSIRRLFEDQAGKTPDHIAVVGDSGGNEMALTYKGLNRRSNQLARLLTGKGVKTDTIVGIMIERSVEMIVGILGILNAGGTYLPIDPGYPRERIDYMLQDGSVRFLVTTTGLSEKLSIVNCQLLMFNEELPVSRGLNNPPKETDNNLQLKGNNLAYIIYTSGTTGKPKGVLIEHFPVVNLAFSQKKYFNIDETDRILQFSSICFDASVEQIFIALYSGAVLVLIDKDSLLDNRRFEAFISSRVITHIHAVPSFLTNMKLKNPRWLRRIISGGDICPMALAKKWSDCCDFYNEYGPTETTVTSTEMRFEGPGDTGEKGEGLPGLPLGKPVDNTTIYLLDKRMNLVPIGVVGELYIGGAGVARGYLNNPGLTSEKFINYKIQNTNYKQITNFKSQITNKKLPGKSSYHMSHMSYIYKTGDLARWLPEGNIDFLGRRDEQVKVRGFRIEPGEIEYRLSGHKNVKEAVVIVGSAGGGDKYLCAYVIPGDIGNFDAAELRDYLSGVFPDYMVPTYFVPLESMPLNINGKVNRKALPEPDITGTHGRSLVPPTDEIEKALAVIWSDVLGQDKMGIGVYDNFFHLGGHSLKAAALIARVHQAFSVEIPILDLFKNPTIKGIRDYIDKTNHGNYTPLRPLEKKEFYPLSPAQKRLYILHQMGEQKEETVYNIPLAVILSGVVLEKRLKASFKKLIRRHESLRTSFAMPGDEPIQRIHDEVVFEIEYYDLQVTGAGDRRKWEEGHHSSFIEKSTHSFIRPFDFSYAPLLRVSLIKMEKQRHILVVDMHHIITDEISSSIFIKEFIRLYSEKELPPIYLDYKDFSGWQNRRVESYRFRKEEDYWLKQFRGNLPVLQLPTDYPRSVEWSYEGSALDFEISLEAAIGLKTLALKQGATLYMVLLALYHIFLSRISSQEDLVVGTPTAGRGHTDTKPGQIIGIFVNTLALRNYAGRRLTFTTFLKDIKNRTLQAFSNQDYPFETLVEKLALKRDTNRNPLFDAIFSFHYYEQTRYVPGIKIPGLKLLPYKLETTTSKFDLALIGFETKEKLEFSFQYRTALFKKETIQRFERYFQELVSSVIEAPHREIFTIEIIPREEKRQILYDFNNTGSGFDHPGNKSIHELFTGQAERTPDHIALIGKNPESGTRNPKQIQMNKIQNSKKEGTLGLAPLYITYRELNKKSDQLARLLIDQGVQRDVIAGIMVERSIEMVIGILGILKAGGAYLPIDANYPGERIRYILEDSGASVLVTTPGLFEEVRENVEIVLLDFSTLLPFYPSTLPSSHPRPSPASIVSLAYIIYTSGSMGRPKGVMVTHRNVVRLVKNTNYIHLSEGERLLMTGSLAFDISTFEIWAPLVHGLRLYLVDENTLPDAEKLGEYIVKNHISILHLIPQLFFQITAGHQEIFAGLKYFLVGGDRVRPGPICQLRKKYRQLTILHMYGPTENTTFSTFFPVNKDYETNLPIGKPVSHSWVYIRGKNGELLPIGVVGELCIGGDGVARGYLNHPELTRENFKIINYKLKIKNGSGTLRVELNAFGETNKNKKAPGKNHEKHMQPCNHATMQHHSPSPHSPLYFTGDLARWLAEGNLEFAGRIDHQVKIRGIRIEPGEIEAQLLNHPQIKEAVVVDKVRKDGDTHLYAYIVSTQEMEIRELREYLSQRLPDYMIPWIFVFVAHFPLTSNGKIDRKSLPEPDIKTREKYAAPGDEMQTQLLYIWWDVLGRKAGIDDNFFELGGHSLKATLMVSKIHKKLNIRVSLAEVFKTPTIRGLARFIQEINREQFPAIPLAEEKEYYALSSAQKRMYILSQLDIETTNYNIPGALMIEGNPDRDRLPGVFSELIRRYESLRTSFRLHDGEPVQIIYKDPGFEVEYLESMENNISNIITGFIRPFDLTRAPLLRVQSVRLAGNKHLFLCDMPHIISDAVSMEILTKEFMYLYTGKNLSPLRLQYKDFSQWQNREKESESMKKQEEYWMKQFPGEIPVLNLPTDFERKEVHNAAGNRIHFSLEADLNQGLKQLTENTHTTIYMILLAAFNVLLFKLTRQEDIVMGTPITGRRHLDLQHIIGMFVNMLPMRNQPFGSLSFGEFLEKVKQTAVAAYENQDYQFDELTARLGLQGNASRNPLFSVVFNMVSADSSNGHTMSDERLTISSYPIDHNTVVFDLILTAVEVDREIVSMSVNYAAALFGAAKIRKMIDYYIDILNQVKENPRVKLENISISHGLLSIEADTYENVQGDFAF